VANELTYSITLDYSDANGVEDGISGTAIVMSAAGQAMSRSQPLISHTTDTPIPLGGVINPVMLVVKNLDPSNVVTIKSATGGTSLSDVPAGKMALVTLPAGTTAPAGRATTGDVRIDVFVA
jgi:hypothetical protein